MRSRKEKKSAFVLFTVIFLTALILLAGLPGCSGKPAAATLAADAGLRAAVIDQLYDIQPNPEFTEGLRRTLAGWGFEAVDVFQGEEVTLDLYLKLPEYGYSLIVLRTHSGILYEDGEYYEGSWLFTSEPCRQDLKHTDQRLTRKVAKARVDESQPWVFAIGSRFIAESMRGRFNGTVVLAMGCHSFKQNDLAKAFIDKGAGAYLGWTSLVNLDYTDQATLALFRKLCREGETIKKALDGITIELGPEPSHDTRMAYFPPSSGEKTLKMLIP